MTREEAIKLSESRWWIGLPARIIVGFQLYEPKLCMDFGDFHKAVEEVLNRSVWTHEFAFPEKLCEEFEGKRLKPSFEDIVSLLPEEKRVLFAFIGGNNV